MLRLMALVLAVVLAWMAARVGADARSFVWLLTLALALAAAWLAGSLFERIHLPRVTAYLLFGMLAGPSGAGIITTAMSHDLQLVNGLAIALIAVIAGLELDYRRVRPRLGAIVRLGGITLLVMYATLMSFLWVAWPWLPIYPEAQPAARAALVVLMTTVVVSFSPTITIAVIAEARARGPLTELSLAFVILSDLALIVLFSLAMQAVRWSLGMENAGAAALAAGLAWEILGSLAYGAALGTVFVFARPASVGATTVAVVALCAAIAAGWLIHLAPLLAGLAAGLVIENVARAGHMTTAAAAQRAALPILLIFFAAAGASLQIGALSTIGPVALVVSAVRFLSIRCSTAVAVRLAGVGAPSDLLWRSLVSQAGVTLGLTILVAREFPDWGLRVQALMLALIAIHELVGPVLFRQALARVREIGGMDR